jgi:16S rRNA processing protein RimM
MVARAQTDVSGRIENLKQVTARLASGCDAPVEIVAARPHKEIWILKCAGVDSIDAAERFRGAELWVPLAKRGVLADGDFFQSDLIGCSVFDRATGERLGQVESWQQYGGPPLMEVIVKGREVLIPFVGALCQVDLEARTIRVDLPDGLLDL